MKLLTLVCVVLFMGVSLARVGIVEACSGGSYDYFETIAVLNVTYEHMTLVSGQVYALSESGINAVLQIDQVIKGEPTDEFILFSRNNPSAIVEGRGFPGCDGYGPRQLAGRRFLAILWRNEDGTGTYTGKIFSEDEEGLFFLKDPNQSDNTLILTYEAFVDYTSQHLDASPYKPQNSARPRLAAIRLKTISGKIYTLPANGFTAHENTDEQDTKCLSFIPFDCVAKVSAPNGFDTVSLYPIGSGAAELMSIDRVYYAALEGEAAVYSPQSDLLTVWAGQELRVYATIGRTELSAENSSQPLLLNTLTFDSQDALLTGAGAWSSNGRTFAFSSQSGVWLWDALTPNAQPTLFLATSDEPIIVRHYSPAGSYLALATPSRRYHLDMMSQQEYPDGLFSPDDRLLAAFDTTSVDLTPLRLYRVLPELHPLWGDHSQKVSQFKWLDDKFYVYAACGKYIFDPEMPFRFDQFWCKVLWHSVNSYQSGDIVDGTLFDYDPITHSLATLIDGDTITVNGEIIELEGQIDSPIISIELIPLIDLDYRNF